MSWQFWKKQQKVEEIPQVNPIQEKVGDIDEKVIEISEQIAKLTRLQFKTSKKLEEKMDDFQSVLSVQVERDKLNSENQVYSMHQSILVQTIIQFLDEIDHISYGLKEKGHMWGSMLRQWSKDLLNSLEQVGIYEIDVMDQTFNPQTTESIRAVSREELDTEPIVAYQVVEVIKRGFVEKNGRLYRKAQVVTLKEENR